MKLIQLNHLEDTDLGYWGHLVFGLRMAALLLACSLVSVVHAVTAVVFPFWGDELLKYINRWVDERTEDRNSFRHEWGDR